MFYRQKTKLQKHYFNFACRKIFNTPPIGSPDDGPVILSEVGNNDVSMYLVAIKSLYNELGKGRIALLIDKDCPQENISIFQKHVRPWKIIFVEDVISHKCPIGGTWERILTIAQLVEDNYVIQVDSDTLTKGDIYEVKKCVNNNTSFMIGTWANQEIEPAAISAERAKSSNSQHVQILGEQNLINLDAHQILHYARGQSSFAGFSKGSLTISALEAFSERMQQLLGPEKWAEWGSESFASNYFVSNAEHACVLPWPKYGSYYPERNIDINASTFIHFEGTNRFKNGAYIKLANSVINAISPKR